MHRGNPRQTMIVGVERGGDRRKASHEPVHWRLAVIGALQQSLDFVSLAHNIVCAAALDQRRVSEQQAVIREGKPEIVGARLAEAPESVDHDSSLNWGQTITKIETKVNENGT